MRLEQLGDGAERVVLLVDGLGWNRLQAQLGRDDRHPPVYNLKKEDAP